MSAGSFVVLDDQDAWLAASAADRAMLRNEACEGSPCSERALMAPVALGEIAK